MSFQKHSCPDCESSDNQFDRRGFLKTVGAGTAAVAAGGLAIPGLAAASDSSPESIVKVLYESLTPKQREDLCFGWDYMDSERGLLRTRVANNWHITEPIINSDYFTTDQRAMIRSIYEGIIQPEWHERVDQQLTDDAGGWGEEQNIAIFGKPAEGKFELVMTGRHMTLRCDGNSADHVAFGGPIFYGHAAEDFNESATHPGNVYWPQAIAANRVFDMLDGKQRKVALVEKRPREQDSGFKPSNKRTGIPVSELSSDQHEEVQKVLQKLIEPYRQSDRDEVTACLKAQGGLKNCNLAFYKDGDIGEDNVWDNWRLEGPAFVWYFRGEPHVHVWVNIANNPSVKLNA